MIIALKQKDSKKVLYIAADAIEMVEAGSGGTEVYLKSGGLDDPGIEVVEPVEVVVELWRFGLGTAQAWGPADCAEEVTK